MKDVAIQAGIDAARSQGRYAKSNYKVGHPLYKLFRRAVYEKTTRPDQSDNQIINKLLK